MVRPQVDVLGLFANLALDPHESSCFDWLSQKLKLIGSIMTKYLIVQIESLVELFVLAF